MPYERSRRYLNAFSEIEAALRNLVQAPKGERFYSLVRKCARKNKIISRHADDLREFADLRNAIVHERCNGEPIAEPHQNTVKQIEKIRDQLIAPPTVEPLFFRKVVWCTPSDPMGKVSKIMFKNSFSQIPIYKKGQCCGLLTTETITRWLAHRLQLADTAALENESVEVVARYCEYKDNYVIASRKATLFEALDCFDGFAKRGRNLDALIITASGESDEKPLGIITVFDLPEIYRVIGL
ncbi:MAG TPA: CBS domain-containing protein [bacterium]|jgi:predicted transcriptional regulator|nr:CBS domain-containing protein [bacterium]